MQPKKNVVIRIGKRRKKLGTLHGFKHAHFPISLGVILMTI